MKTGKIHALLICIIICFLSFTGISSAQTPPQGEEELFTTSTAPDALLLLDLSGSMDWNPANGTNKYGGNSCSGTFYSTSSGTHTTDCRKIAIAKRAIFSILDDNNDNKIDSTDRTSLGVRFGYMRYNGCGTGDEEAHIKYAGNPQCTADSTSCPGSGSSYYIYGHDATCTANSNPGNCAGSPSPTYIYGHDTSCVPDDSTGHCTGHSGDCSGGYCQHSHTGCSKNCALDCSGGFCHNSKTGCNVNCGSCGGGFCNASTLPNCTYACPNPIYNYNSGCNTKIADIDTKYSCIFCSDLTSCASPTVGCTTGANACSNGDCVSGETADGGTPLAAAVHEAKRYLDDHKALDASAACRKKFVILITDGSDTLACGADGSECAGGRYKNRRESVAMAKEMADAGYQMFVIGFGSNMPTYLQNTLNWMAYYGGTDDPNVVNAGDTSAYNIPSGYFYPQSPDPLTSCKTDTSAVTATCYDAGAISTANYQASSNDPGYLNLSGYAFLAADADALAMALKTAVSIIKEATYSFTQASVQTSRTVDENFIYEASFEPVSGAPFWHGHLKKYQINTDGSVGNLLADAGDTLQLASYTSRLGKMYTCKTGILTPFDTTNITPAALGVADNTDRDNVVGYIQGNPAFNPDQKDGNVYKLGDVFRSTPITVGTPNFFFDDVRDANNAFATHRANHIRTSALGNRLVVVGANDGQLHAFKTTDMSEVWSFIPPNLLPKLKNIAHMTNPTALTHEYFVDGPVTVADVWLGTGDGKSKNYLDWHTVMVFAEARGGSPNLWSSSQYCDSGFNSVYSTSYPFYCGYYALNLDSPLSQTFMWHLGGTSGISSSRAPYLGDPWSKMMTGRVMISGNERWVGFIGAGDNGSTCTGVNCGVDCDCRGKGFFVIDLSDGTILWSFTVADNANMQYGIPAAPAIVDLDNDGLIDTAYLGDLGGNVWRFKFCKAADGTSCNTTNWSGGRFFNGTTVDANWQAPIYTIPAVALDGAGNIWVYWGTGNKIDPTASGGGSNQGVLFALKDMYKKCSNDVQKDCTVDANCPGGTCTTNAAYGFNDLADITAAGATFDNTTSTKKGYYIELSGGGEKILADPTVFGGWVYFTSYKPTNTICDQSGTAYLYSIQYTSGAGQFSSGGSVSRSMNIGSGIPSAPVISISPTGGTDLYVTTSGTGNNPVGQKNTQDILHPTGFSNPTSILYWRDRRLQ